MSNSVLNKAVLSEKAQDEILNALHGLSSLKVSEADLYSSATILLILIK